MDENARKIKDLYTVRDLIVAEIKYLKKSRDNNVELSLGGHITAWEGFLWRVDSILLGHPENAIKEVNGWAIGDVFSLDEFSGVLYKVENFIDHNTVKASCTTLNPMIPGTIQRPIQYCKRLYKTDDEMDKDDNIKRKKKKKKEKENKAIKEKKRFKVGQTTKKEKKFKIKPKNGFQLNLFEPVKKKKKKKNKK
jgi:hypothetical protein